MDRERAETHLRLLAEPELRRVMAMPAGSIRDRWYSANLVLVAQALMLRQLQLPLAAVKELLACDPGEAHR